MAHSADAKPCQAARDAKDTLRVRTVLSAEQIVYDTWLREESAQRTREKEMLAAAQLATYHAEEQDHLFAIQVKERKFDELDSLLQQAADLTTAPRAPSTASSAVTVATGYAPILSKPDGAKGPDRPDRGATIDAELALYKQRRADKAVARAQHKAVHEAKKVLQRRASKEAAIAAYRASRDAL